MQNPKDISDPIIALDMALELMSKAFQLNNITPINNNQRSVTDSEERVIIAQAYCKLSQRKRDDVFFRNNYRLTQKDEVWIQLNYEEFDFMAAAGAYDEIEKVTANCNLQDNLQQASTLGTQSDKAPVYDLDGSDEVHHSKNCYDNDIFNMFTQEEQYTELLEPIPQPTKVNRHASYDISVVYSVEKSRGTVEQHPANVEKTRVLYDSLYNNLAIEVEKVNSVNRKLRETNVDLTTELARYKNQEKCFEISKEKYDKLERCYQKSVYQEQCLTKKINALHLSSDLSNLQTELERTKERFENCIIKKENEYAKLWNDWYKKCEECKYDKISYDKAYNDMQQKIERLQAQLGDQKGKSKDTPCVSNTLDPLSQKLKNKNVELEFQVLNYAKENAHLKTTYKNLFDSIKVTQAQTKAIIDSLQDKLHDTIYENTKLRDQLFDKVSEQKDTNKGTSVNSQFSKQSILGKPPSSSKPKLYSVTPFPKSTVIPKVGKSNALSKQVISNSAPSSRESTIVNNERVIAPGIFRINHFKASRNYSNGENQVVSKSSTVTTADASDKRQQQQDSASSTSTLTTTITTDVNFDLRSDNENKQDVEMEDTFPMACNFDVRNCSKLRENHEVGFVDQRSFLVEKKKEKSLDYNNSFLGEYECSSLALDREERRDEKKRLDHLKQDQTMLVIKRFSERKKVFKERKKARKIHAKRSVFQLEIVQYASIYRQESPKVSWWWSQQS
ncbi:hypothetical protein Tco_1133897 [Tanacetum coccineum]